MAKGQLIVLESIIIDRKLLTVNYIFMSPLLILVDGHSLAYRSYFAYAKSKSGGLMTSAGVPTSICFGFAKAAIMTINILMHKSWHVWNRDNLEKIERDEM